MANTKLGQKVKTLQQKQLGAGHHTSNSNFNSPQCFTGAVTSAAHKYPSISQQSKYSQGNHANRNQAVHSRQQTENEAGAQT